MKSIQLVKPKMKKSLNKRHIVTSTPGNSGEIPENLPQIYSYLFDKKRRGKGVAWKIVSLFLKSRVIYGWQSIHPSQQTMADWFGVSRESVNRALQRLIVTGLIKRTYRTDTSNEYHLAPCFFEPHFRHMIKDLFPCLMGISLAMLFSNTVAYLERPFTAFDRTDEVNVTLYKKGREEIKNETAGREDLEDFSATRYGGTSTGVYNESDTRNLDQNNTNLLDKQTFMADPRMAHLPANVKEMLWNAEQSRQRKRKEGTINAAYHSSISRSSQKRTVPPSDRPWEG